MSLWQRFIDWLRRLFVNKNIELCMVGLEQAGKTSLVNLLAAKEFKTTVVPTVGFNMRKVRRGGVVMKVWDLGGQKRFRGMWERYCRGVQAIVFVVDGAERSKFTEAETELRSLLQRQSIENVPLLVIVNKIDLPNVARKDEIFVALQLESLSASREVAVYMMSCKTRKGYSQVLQWLIRHSYYEDN